MERGTHTTPNLFVCGEQYTDIDEVRTLMQGETVEEHQLAIDALKGWCFFIEEHTTAPKGKNFYDRHHWQRKRDRRGSPRNQINSHGYTQLLRRDVHELVERSFGWLGRLPIPVVLEFLESEAA